MKYSLKINLQLFAGEEEIELPDDFEIDEEEEEIEVDLEEEPEEDYEEIDTEKKEPDTKPKEQPKEEPHKDHAEITAKAVIAERKKWQKRMQELEEKFNASSHKEEDPIEKQLIDSGFDEATAKLIKSVVNKNNDKTYNVEKLVNKKFRDMEFKELSKDPLFSDAGLYREDIEELMDKGLSAEQAYLAKFGKGKITKSRADIEREAEQRVLANIKKKQGMVFDSTDNGEASTAKSRAKLSKDEMQIAKAAGMSPQEYYAAKNFKTVDKLDKVFNKKKG